MFPRTAEPTKNRVFLYLEDAGSSPDPHAFGQTSQGMIYGLRGGLETKKNGTPSLREFCVAPFTLKHLAYLVSFYSVGACSNDPVIGMRAYHMEPTATASWTKDMVGHNRSWPSKLIASRYVFYVFNCLSSTVGLRVIYGLTFWGRLLVCLFFQTTAGLPSCVTKPLAQFPQWVPIGPSLAARSCDFKPNNKTICCSGYS